MSVKVIKDVLMIIYELIINVFKYGFLMKLDVLLEICWQLEDDYLNVQWKEIGLFGICEFVYIGFGFQLFDMFLNVGL